MPHLQQPENDASSTCPEGLDASRLIEEESETPANSGTRAFRHLNFPAIVADFDTRSIGRSGTAGWSSCGNDHLTPLQGRPLSLAANG